MQIETTSVAGLVARNAKPLREGEVMGAYMDFDRFAPKDLTPAEYLTQFGMHISRITSERSGLVEKQIPVRDAVASWRAVDQDGNNVGGGCSLEGWLRAVRWTETTHGIEA